VQTKFLTTICLIKTDFKKNGVSFDEARDKLTSPLKFAQEKYQFAKRERDIYTASL
jgi:hypothetical protein